MLPSICATIQYVADDLFRDEHDRVIVTRDLLKKAHVIAPSAEMALELFLHKRGVGGSRDARVSNVKDIECTVSAKQERDCDVRMFNVVARLSVDTVITYHVLAPSERLARLGFLALPRFRGVEIMHTILVGRPDYSLTVT